jgi:glycine/D-amino acid oxidase-like deaminating enzyme
MSGAAVIIIGAGVAGWTTAREFRKLKPDTHVFLVTSRRFPMRMRKSVPRRSWSPPRQPKWQRHWRSR